MDYVVLGKTDCWKWQKSPDTAPNKDKKMACEDPTCCNPRHVVATGEEKAELLKEANTINSEVDATKGAIIAFLRKRKIPFRKNASYTNLLSLVDEKDLREVVNEHVKAELGHGL